MKIFSLLFPKKKQKLKVPRPYTIKNNYACENIDLELNIKAYLNGTISAEECFERIIELMAYRDCFHVEENAIIFPLLKDLVEKATWKEEWTADCGDYNPKRPEPWLRCIYSIYGSMLFDIECSENLLRDWGKEITTETFMEVNRNKSITASVYAQKDQFEAKKNELKSIIEKGDYTPLDALKMIEENWSVLYPYQSTYEAMEYCVQASTNHTDKKYYGAELRNLGYELGTLYRKAIEK